MKKILVVNYDKSVTYPFESEQEVKCILLLPHHSLFFRILARALLLLGLGGILFEVSMRNIKLDQYDLVIVNEMIHPIQVLRFFRRKNKHCKLVYLLWNTLFKGWKNRLYNVQKEVDLVLKDRKKEDYIVVSFDREDCLKYGILYHNQFAPRSNMIRGEHIIDTDIFFAGQDKNRLSLIKKLDAIFKQSGLKFRCWLVPFKTGNRESYVLEDQKFIWGGCHNIPYEEIIEADLRSRAILDLVQEGQHGITWRPIEALFYKKKLITNFSEIKGYDFYRKENIFILGEDDIRQLREFMDAPYVEVSEKVIFRYTFKGWLNDVFRD